MRDVFQTLIGNQYGAAFRTLDQCARSCPDESWDGPVCGHDFCQVLFHGLFWADLYLGPNPDVVGEQSFHRDHAKMFLGYEELEDKRPERHYEREFIENYLAHCRAKAATAIEQMTVEGLRQPSGFNWIKGSRAEVHVYNIRHIQHHAAQLSLRLRLDHGIDIPWVKSGFGEESGSSTIENVKLV